MYQRFLLSLALIASVFLTNCSNNPFDIDVSDSNIELEFIDFNTALFSIDSSNLQASAAALQAKYPEIYTLYFNKILPVVNSADSLHLNIAHQQSFL
jgi:hypothetical protein